MLRLMKLSARKKSYMDALPFLVGIFFLVLMGVGIVMDEARHMSDLDTFGMLATIVAPAVISVIALLFTGMYSKN